MCVRIRVHGQAGRAAPKAREGKARGNADADECSPLLFDRRLWMLPQSCLEAVLLLMQSKRQKETAKRGKEKKKEAMVKL